MAEDKRIVKTRRNIEDAFLSLLAEMPFEEITVKAIVARAVTVKGTFYNHYDDKFDLARTLIDRTVATYNDVLREALAQSDDSQHMLRKARAGIAPLVPRIRLLGKIRTGKLDIWRDLQVVITAGYRELANRSGIAGDARDIELQARILYSVLFGNLEYVADSDELMSIDRIVANLSQVAAVLSRA